MRDYYLHELSTQEFEELIIQICQGILGMGTINFSEGPDGGRDGKFEGIANLFPSKSGPWSGKFIIQAKRTTNPIASCSDSDFKTKILDREIPKILKLKTANDIDNYLLFTNRKLSAEAHKQHLDYLREKIGLDNINIFGIEKITLWLNSNPSIVQACNLDRFRNPLRIHPDDLKELIIAFHKNREALATEFDGRYSFEYLEIERKNEINKLSESYFKYIKENSESYFNDILAFLKKPISKKYADLYYNTIDELKSKITIRRNEFAQFEEIFEHLYDAILDRFPELRKSRKLINVFLHYMYCNCDIGEKC